MSSEYFIPTVKSQSQKYVPENSSMTASAQKYIQNEYLKDKENMQSENDAQSQISVSQKSYQQKSQKSALTSQKSPNPTQHNFLHHNIDKSRKQEQISEQSKQDQSRKQTKANQNSEQFQSQYTPIERPQSAQSNTSYASRISQQRNQGQSGLLEWNIVETHHGLRNPKDKYQKGKQLQSNPNQREQNDKNFKNTRVETCSKVVVVNGVAKAIPSYKKPPANSFQKSQALQYTQSVNQDKQNPKPFSSCGDRKKPLAAYNPNASRNRLPEQDIKMPHKNASTIQFGTVEKDKKHFLSTKQNQQGYKNKTHFENPNQGINAYRTTWYKKQENK